MVSAREFYAYRLQIRNNTNSILLESARLLQQFTVDMYVKIETSRLDYFRNKQEEIRADLYQGIIDSIEHGESDPSKIGKRIVLPGTFIGGPRDMRKRYLNAMTLVERYGKPDLFLTMTCNPNWQEIKDQMKPHEEAQNRPDLVSRVFKSKLEHLQKEIVRNQLFGPVIAYTFVVEFQKRGLPHVHMLMILKKPFKLDTIEKIDALISAEIPDKKKYPHLYAMVIKHMMHGPCGELDITKACMQDGKCKNHFPRNHCAETSIDADGYPMYRRRLTGEHVQIRGQMIDNRWIVPYNPYLLAMFDCHINVEVCSTIKAVKYLYKYIYKGHDKIIYRLVTSKFPGDIDEIQQYQAARWISPPEATWRIFRFALHEIRPAVISLQLHLEGFNPLELFFKFEDDMAEDYVSMQKLSKDAARQVLLQALNAELESMGKNLHNFQLSDLLTSDSTAKPMPKEVQDEINIPISEDDLRSPSLLNAEQRIAYDEILDAVLNQTPKSFFIDGPGGSGKTFLYRALLGIVRSQHLIALATASSGVAASILPNGRTAHSRFKIPINSDGKLCCNISKQSASATLMKQAALIIWDEASMAKKESIEALDSLLRDLTENDTLFRGKVVVLGGDFRQVLPVIPKGTKIECINASLVRSYIWQSLIKFKLKENMLAKTDPAFSAYILQVGSGLEKENEAGEIKLPSSLILQPTTNTPPLDKLIQFVFPSFDLHRLDPLSLTNSAILTPKNLAVDEINETMIAKFPGKEYTYLSFDETSDPTQQGLYIDFLNSITPPGMPCHHLGLTLATRNSSSFIFDPPPLLEVTALQSWCTANAAKIRELPIASAAQLAMPTADEDSENDITKIANLPMSVEKTQYLNVQGIAKVTISRKASTTWLAQTAREQQMHTEMETFGATTVLKKYPP
ncbi:hypothetical protein RHGRI_023890 [Rhododendron griersonianum]|uniref:ATP-dependent DNA helicase n=1 Tax=Rhododendron griersonianum TaxID=479676 RepID=A0AAV6J8H4_9ERIC|nr:hypothetical protein RHGRI_023890 [Rhododendron griersonianum]